MDGLSVWASRRLETAYWMNYTGWDKEAKKTLLSIARQIGRLHEGYDEQSFKEAEQKAQKIYSLKPEGM